MCLRYFSNSKAEAGVSMSWGSWIPKDSHAESHRNLRLDGTMGDFFNHHSFTFMFTELAHGHFRLGARRVEPVLVV